MCDTDLSDWPRIPPGFASFRAPDGPFCNGTNWAGHHEETAEYLLWQDIQKPKDLVRKRCSLISNESWLIRAACLTTDSNGVASQTLITSSDRVVWCYLSWPEHWLTLIAVIKRVAMLYDSVAGRQPSVTILQSSAVLYKLHRAGGG